MELRIYNHQYLNDDYTWVYTFIDQIKEIEDSGLYDNVDSIHVTALGNETQIKVMEDLAKSWDKVVLHKIYTHTTTEDIKNHFGKGGEVERTLFLTENVTLKRIWQDSQKDDFLCLYMHSKGGSAFVKHLKTGNPNLFMNIYYWRKYLEWGTVENWKQCVNLIENRGCDIAGVNFNAHPFKHFSGGFWWARSDYIRTLDDVSNSAWWKSVKRPEHVDRLVDEMWPCSGTDKIGVLHTVGPELQSPNPGLYSISYLRENYVK